MKIVKDGYPLIAGIPGVCAVAAMIVTSRAPAAPWAAWALWGLGLAGCLFMIYFVRDPERTPAGGPDDFVSGAEGVVRSVEFIEETRFLKCPAVRISVFLNPFNVHVNRAPMGGTVTALAYTPGKHLLTYSNAASEWNEHSAILIEGNGTRCLVKQIVGPIVRRVVYWLKLQQPLVRGERIGMMKFGSRLDMYFPKADVAVLVKKGDRVRAGETVVAQLLRKAGS